MKYSPELGNNSLGVHIKYCDELILVPLINISSSCSDPCCDVYCVPVSVQCRLLVPLRTKRTLRGAPVTVSSQKMRTSSGDCPELLLGNSNINSSDVVRDRGHSQHLFTPAGRIPVTPGKQVNGNMNVERQSKILIAVASVGPKVMVFLFLIQMTSLPLTRTAMWMNRWNLWKRTAGSRFQTLTLGPVKKAQNRIQPQTWVM